MNISTLLDLSGKTAIVTGGGNGIGAGCCKMLAQANANVVVSDYVLADAERVAGEINQHGGRAIALCCDVTCDDELVQLVEGTLAEFGNLHILVNNVGDGDVGEESPFSMEVGKFAKTFELNVFSMWRLCQLCAPHMQEAKYGSIINMSSMASVNTCKAMSAYAASKAAINHMTANLAFDYGPDVRINAIGPGAVRTGALYDVLTPAIEQKMLSHTPLQRLGEVEDIAATVLYFASPLSRWVTGQTLFVNGGGVQTLD